MIKVPVCEHRYDRVKIELDNGVQKVSVELCVACREDLVRQLQETVVPDWVEVQHKGEYN